MMRYLFIRYLKKMMARGHTDAIMDDVVFAAKEVFYEDNAFTTEANLKEHLSDALCYHYQVYR